MIKPLRLFLAFSRVVLLVVPMAFLLILYIGLVKTIFTHNHHRAFRLRRWYLKYANFILGIKTEVQGEVKHKNALYVSNHRSMSDPLILCQYLDAFIIAKAEVANYPLISTGAEVTGVLYVKRDDKDSRQAVRQKMKETLDSKQNVLVYPEGTVNCNKHTMKYRPGTFKEVVKMGITVIPICLEYKDKKDVWCNRSMLDHFLLQFGYWRTQTKLIIGPEISHADGDQLCLLVEAWTNSTIDKVHENWASYFRTHDSVSE